MTLNDRENLKSRSFSLKAYISYTSRLRPHHTHPTISGCIHREDVSGFRRLKRESLGYKVTRSPQFQS